ncbi:MAG: hypothetical protein ACKVOR_00905 [Flavobacteriales bacterium]
MEENKQEITPPTLTVKKHIVVYGKHDYIIKNVIDLLLRADYNATGYIRLEEVLDHMRLSSFDAVLIGGGVDPHDRLEIKTLVNNEYRHARVIEHYGGPATIIQEIKSVLVE